MTKYVVREWIELITDSISFGEDDQRVFEHAGLPIVKDSLSVTLRLKINKRLPFYATIFHKGTTTDIRTPILQLTENTSTLHARFTGNWDSNVGIHEPDDALSLNKWYHIAYTLSDPGKRLDIYVDGEWVGFYGIHKVKKQKVVFNDAPFYIGKSVGPHRGFNGDISNVRYFNWCLSPEEVKEDFFNGFQKRPIKHGSKIALVHVSTRKYLSTKGIKYDLGPDNQQYMAICSAQEIDLKNDVWIVIGANGTNVSTGSPVSLNTIIGFKHKETGFNLHSHDMNDDKVTPISKQQQVTMCRDVNTDDDWFIRRYNSNTTSYDDSGRLMNGDVISLFHITTSKPALCSNTILLGDGSQEVFCSHGDGSDKNNKWRIELIE
ncbi:hypothetical protein RclHR1_13740005 [Rhizophagus clarus]|uniref:Glycosyltransferase family 39 protein n=1 Tax=Rhizophagus clarus TaxID=94130 RepID=A0A2Z6QAY4_9GLOM|nr:hypothetical protein RclHR1_13740005 [Rhizophagus clarus]GES75954.1 glycosyltransferase family 39 protein [Rhizophagus clarus]